MTQHPRQRPLISIITPTYNRLGYLREAITSVRRQHYENWELLLVDDGSTDGTAAFISGLNDARIRYFHQENQQAAAARNRGIREARGEYLCFLDDDDWLLPEHLQTLVNELNETPAPYPVYRTGQIQETAGTDFRTAPWDNERAALTQFWETPTGAFCYFFRTAAVREIAWPEELLLLEDFAWMNTVLSQHACRQLPDYTVRVRRHPEQRSSTYLNDDLLRQNLRTLVRCHQLPGVPERVPFELYRRQVAHQYLHYVRQLARNGERGRALKILNESKGYLAARDVREAVKTIVKIGLGAG